MSYTSSDLTRFRRTVWRYYRTHGRRELPWRKTRNPYRILVSEVMLQQTRVERVTLYYEEFLKRFRTPEALAKAPLSDVLRVWQGLGYNRRAKMLHLAAKQMNMRMPKSAEELRELPGVGPYTAQAVAAFAYNEDGVCIETNIRTAVTHHFFKDKEDIHDREILTILERVYPKGRAREWYAALMDYGAHLKRSGVRLNAKSKTYTKQKPFKGSDREVRGTILRALLAKPHTRAALTKSLGKDREEQIIRQLKKLAQEELVEKRGGWYYLSA